MRSKFRYIMVLVCLCMLVGGCAKGDSSATKKTKVDTVSKLAANVDSIEVTSKSVDSNGVLKKECCGVKAAPKGENKCPEISWKPVEGVGCYAVYMVDKDVQNFVHFRLGQVTKTTIPEGVVTAENMYVGPFPPSGTHHYQILVYALKEDPVIYEGELGKAGDIEKIEQAMDVVNGKAGNVIGVGTLECTVTRGK